MGESPTWELIEATIGRSPAVHASNRTQSHYSAHRHDLVMYVVRCPLPCNLLMSRSTIRTLVVIWPDTVAFAVIGAADMLDTIAIRAPPPREHGLGSVV